MTCCLSFSIKCCRNCCISENCEREWKCHSKARFFIVICKPLAQWTDLYTWVMQKNKWEKKKISYLLYRKINLYYSVNLSINSFWFTFKLIIYFHPLLYYQIFLMYTETFRFSDRLFVMHFFFIKLHTYRKNK